MGRQIEIHKVRHDQSFEGYFETVYTEFFKPLYRYARSIARSDDIAKDVVSELFFNLWKSQIDLSKIKELKSYLFRSVKNQVVKTLTNDPRSFDSIDTENFVKQIERVSPEDILLEKELLFIIEQAIAGLPDQCRLIFSMAKSKQLNYAGIAEELGVSQSTVKTQVARAIAVIRQATDTYYSEGDIHHAKRLGIGGLLYLVAILLPDYLQGVVIYLSKQTFF